MRCGLYQAVEWLSDPGTSVILRRTQLGNIPTPPPRLPPFSPCPSQAASLYWHGGIMMFRLPLNKYQKSHQFFKILSRIISLQLI